MKKKLYLVGAGDLGREMESWLEVLPYFHREWEIKGYLDRNPAALDGYPTDYSIVGDPFDFNFMPDDHVLICVADTKQKKELVAKLKLKVIFFSYLAPNAILSKSVSLGEGTIICPNTCLMTNLVIGDFVFLMPGTQIGHDCIIGAYSSLMAHVDLGGHVNIGEGVFMGTKSTIIPSITVNDDIVIGTGSVVLRNLTKLGTYFGNPATLVSFKKF